MPLLGSDGLLNNSGDSRVDGMNLSVEGLDSLLENNNLLSDHGLSLDWGLGNSLSEDIDSLSNLNDVLMNFFNLLSQMLDNGGLLGSQLSDMEASSILLLS